MRIDMRGARSWEANLSSLRPDMNDPAVAAAWAYCWGMVNEHQTRAASGFVARDVLRRPAPSVPPWIHQLDESMRTILIAAARLDLGTMSALENVIGLGPGLTPTGDDLITGYLAGLWCTALGKSERLEFLAALGELVLRLSDRTDDISRTYLFYAARGEASSRLVDLAAAICRGGSQDEVSESANAQMQVGHTSGMDAATGLLLGLASWDALLLLPRM